MPDPFIMFIGGYIATNAPTWLKAMRGTLLDTSKGLIVEKGKGWLNEKEQERHLQQILKKAVQQGRTKFRKQQEREQYKDVLTVLFEPGEHNDSLRQEAMTLFSLNPTPDIAELNEIYNRSLRTRALAQSIPPAEVHASPFLISFFDALIIELYADPFFKSQIRDVVQTRAAMILPSSLHEANTTLHQIHEAINPGYTKEQFEQDVAKYTTYVEQTLHTLKIIGFLPKDQKQDPEINGIFVPLRVALRDHANRQEEQQNTIVSSLEQHSHMVLLGAPGSGKSTAVRHLAWSHAWANQEQGEDDSVPLLSGHPLPLRIELRLLMQDRKQNSAYNFLSYATEVLLGREGITVNPQMFEQLLAQKRMLVLFDGLDEVTTLDERQRLVQEIEHFVGLYPGNRILVTSRPVGYELASCSQQLFTHTLVEDFNDDQIHQFLERWYTYVLRLSPLPYQERQELETLFKTLKENTRLHKLAENLLLLTVITALYRSQRLPEKRVQVYDKCAELLLAIWAKLKGTDARWSMKLGEEDQFACIAHLGYTLHKRSQEENNTQETAADVPERFMLREIENFLKSRKLISEVAEQRKEAKLFLNLMQIEAGLIVERGKDENGESIYGFVHRTFQEYFAARDIYERFIDEEDAAIIRDFLIENLHDPHWHEVILLLLGKLGRKPATQRLRQILDGTIKSRRSRYTEIVQQDLFFVCDCLIEEIVVENDLVEQVISLLSYTVLNSPFLSQSERAVRSLGQLMQTKQCAIIAEKEMKRLITSDKIPVFSLKITIAETLHESSNRDSEEQRMATLSLLALAQQPQSSFDQQLQALQALYRYSFEGLQEKHLAVQSLLALAQQPLLSFDQQLQALRTLYLCSPAGSQEKQFAVQSLLSLAQQPQPSFDQQLQALQTLYQHSPRDSKERQLTAQTLWNLTRSEAYTQDQLLGIATIPIAWYDARYVDKMQSISFLQRKHLVNDLECYLLKHWSNLLIVYYEQNDDIPFIVDLALCTSLSFEIRNTMYMLLERQVAQFSKIFSSNISE